MHIVGERLMEKLVLIISSILFLLLFSNTAIGQDDLAEYINKSKQENKYVLIVFFADWCGPCRSLHDTTLKTNAMYHFLKNYNILRVNIDDRPEVFQGFKNAFARIRHPFQVSGVPCYFIINPLLPSSNNIIRWGKGYKTVEQFQNWVINND